MRKKIQPVQRVVGRDCGGGIGKADQQRQKARREGAGDGRVFISLFYHHAPPSHLTWPAPSLCRRLRGAPVGSRALRTVEGIRPPGGGGGAAASSLSPLETPLILCLLPFASFDLHTLPRVVMLGGMEVNPVQPGAPYPGLSQKDPGCGSRSSTSSDTPSPWTGWDRTPSTSHGPSSPPSIFCFLMWESLKQSSAHTSTACFLFFFVFGNCFFVSGCQVTYFRLSCRLLLVLRMSSPGGGGGHRKAPWRHEPPLYSVASGVIKTLRVAIIPVPPVPVFRKVRNQPINPVAQQTKGSNAALKMQLE